MNPKATGNLLAESDDVFALVNAVARRARNLVDMSSIDKVVLAEKPLTTAINEFNGGGLYVVKGDNGKSTNRKGKKS